MHFYVCIDTIYNYTAAGIKLVLVPVTILFKTTFHLTDSLLVLVLNITEKLPPF